MWSRVVEIMLGCWLLISPFIFQYSDNEPSLWINDFICGTAVIVFGLLSYWRRARHAHLMTLVVGTWLIAFAYWIGFGDPPPASQNHALLGLLLLMFAVIPNDATRPPEDWKQEVAPEQRH